MTLGQLVAFLFPKVTGTRFLSGKMPFPMKWLTGSLTMTPEGRDANPIIRLHCTTSKMWPIATDGLAWSVCLSVSLSQLWAQPNWLNLFRCHLRCVLRWAQGNVLDGVQIATCEGAIMRGGGSRSKWLSRGLQSPILSGNLYHGHFVVLSVMCDHYYL